MGLTLLGQSNYWTKSSGIYLLTSALSCFAFICFCPQTNTQRWKPGSLSRDSQVLVRLGFATDWTAKFLDVSKFQSSCSTSLYTFCVLYWNFLFWELVYSTMCPQQHHQHCGKGWKCHGRKNRHPHPFSFFSPHGAPNEDLPAHTCRVALVLSIFVHTGFSRITDVALTVDDTVLLTLTSLGTVWSYPGLPSLGKSCVHNILLRCSALQCSKNSMETSAEVQPGQLAFSQLINPDVVSPRAWEGRFQPIYLTVLSCENRRTKQD